MYSKTDIRPLLIERFNSLRHYLPSSYAGEIHTRLNGKYAKGTIHQVSGGHRFNHEIISALIQLALEQKEIIDGALKKETK